MKAINIASVLLMMLFSPLLHANCASISNVTDSTTLSNMFVERDAPIGSVITTLYTPSESGLWASNCTGSEILGYTLVYSNTLSTLGQHIYDTSVPGVGIRVSNSSNNSMTFDSPQGEYPYSASNYGWFGAKVEFIVTGKVSSGQLKSGQLATMAITNTDGSFQVGYTMNITAASVTSLACSINSGNNLSFPIGNVAADQFDSIGSFSKETSTADLVLNCDANANVNVTLKGTQNPGTSDNSILAISNQGQNGTADGIGVQLVYNGVPLEINKLINLKKSSGGQEVFSITARYIQIKDKIKAGSANAIATLDITYQ